MAAASTVVVNSEKEGMLSFFRSNKRRVLLVSGLLVLFVGAIISIIAFTSPQFKSLLFPEAAVPEIQFLGGGDGFVATAGEGEFLYIKHVNEDNNFIQDHELVAGPVERTLQGNHARAWRCSGDCQELTTIVDGSATFGRVEEGQNVIFYGVDDDPDGRGTSLRVQGQVVRNIKDGSMVFSGSFAAPRSGELQAVTQDSIGVFMQIEDGPAPTPSPSPGPVKIDLRLTKDLIGESTREKSELITWRVTVENEGQVAATGVTVEDVLPNGLSFESANATLGSYSVDASLWTIGALDVGQSETLNIVTILTADPGDTVTNTAQVETANEEDVDSIPGNDVETEDDQDSASVGVEATPSPSPTPSPTPEPTDPPVGGPEPTPTPTAAPTLTPTPTPTPAPVSGPSSTATPEELPAAGIGSPTILGIGAGVMILLGVLLFAL